jgi:kojibiose phosphorylase
VQTLSPLEAASPISPPTSAVERGEGTLTERWSLEAQVGETWRLDRMVTVFTSRETERPAPTAAEHLAYAFHGGADALVRAHRDAWEKRWRAAGVEIEGDESLQRALRFAAYHLISAANPEDERVSIGARTLTGESYKGHVFWDTDVFMLPFYTFTDPRSARALLMYRFHTLDGAREKASELGYRGALYPWESADTGRETTPKFMIAPDGEVLRVLSGLQEHHISADVAWASWLYWKATGDDAFFKEAGAERIPPVPVAAGDDARVTVGGDGFVWVVQRTGGWIAVSKFSSCETGMQPQPGFPKNAVSVSDPACPVAGLDRCGGA